MISVTMGKGPLVPTTVEDVRVRVPSQSTPVPDISKPTKRTVTKGTLSFDDRGVKSRTQKPRDAL